MGEAAFHNTEFRVCHADFSCSSISAIPASAFYSSNITSLKLGDSIISIDTSAFENCEHLWDVELSSSLQTIDNNAFNGCSISKIIIPASVSMIGNDVFTNCSDKLVITVESGTYAEVWARTSGYSYVVNGQEEDTSWLNN